MPLIILSSLLFINFSALSSTTEFRRTPRVLNEPLMSIGFTNAEVKRINITARENMAPGSKFKRLTVRDVAIWPRRRFGFYRYRNSVLFRLGQVGLTLEMTEDEVSLFEKDPNNPLFKSVSSLSDLIGENLVKALQNGGGDRYSPNFIILDLVKAQQKSIASSLTYLRPLDRVRVAQSLNQRLGGDDAARISRYLDDPVLLKRFNDANINTLEDLLNLPEEELFARNFFTGFEQVFATYSLIKDFQPLVNPECEDNLRYGFED